jgi:hypothetical protein
MNEYSTATTTFLEFEKDFSFFTEQIRDEVASLLGEALKSCPEEGQAALVDKVSTAYESLNAMKAILRHTASLANQHSGYVLRSNLHPDGKL